MRLFATRTNFIISFHVTASQMVSLNEVILNTQQLKLFDRLFVWVIQTIFSLHLLLFGC